MAQTKPKSRRSVEEVFTCVFTTLLIVAKMDIRYRLDSKRFILSTEANWISSLSKVSLKIFHLLTSSQQVFKYLIALHWGHLIFALYYTCRHKENCAASHPGMRSLPRVSHNTDGIVLHLWSEWLRKYTTWGVKGRAQVKADWRRHCLARLHFICRSPRWPQALWPWGQCQSLRMLIKWDKPAPFTQVACLSSGESGQISQGLNQLPQHSQSWICHLMPPLHLFNHLFIYLWQKKIIIIDSLLICNFYSIST